MIQTGLFKFEHGTHPVILEFSGGKTGSVIWLDGQQVHQTLVTREEVNKYFLIRGYDAEKVAQQLLAKSPITGRNREMSETTKTVLELYAG